MAFTLVIGGAGRTGRQITSRLLERDIAVRVFSRHPRAATRGGAENVRGDLASLDTDVLSDVSGVIVTVEPPADAASADALMHRGVASLAALAAAAHVPVVLVSQIYISRPGAHPALRDVITSAARAGRSAR